MTDTELDKLAEAWVEGMAAGATYGTEVAETHVGYRDTLPIRPTNPYREEER